MTNKKAQNITKAQNYKNEKLEIANELGVASNIEVNAKVASQNEAKYSKKTMNRKSHIANGDDYTGRMNI